MEGHRRARLPRELLPAVNPARAATPPVALPPSLHLGILPSTVRHVVLLLIYGLIKFQIIYCRND